MMLRASRAKAAAGLTLAALSPGAAAQAPSCPPRTVLLLVAPWCAPCHAELARIDDLARAAAPFALRAVAAEDTRGARRMVAPLAPERRWDASAAQGGVLMRDTAGLPYSVATDTRGGICARHYGGLDPASVRAMVRRCLAAS